MNVTYKLDDVGTIREDQAGEGEESIKKSFVTPKPHKVEILTITKANVNLKLPDDENANARKSYAKRL